METNEMHKRKMRGGGARRGIKPTVVSLKTSRLKQESTEEGERREERDTQITQIKYKHRERFREKQACGVNTGKQGRMQP